jgi:ABC-type lipoprotein release transport system permease subunit
MVTIIGTLLGIMLGFILGFTLRQIDKESEEK